MPRRAAVVAVSVLLLTALVGAVPAGAQDPLDVRDPVRSALDGDPATTERVGAADPLTAAIAVSQQRFSDAGGDRPAAHVVLARDDDFADALTGAALTTDAPLLLTPPDALDPAVRAEVARLLGAGGLVHLLGGPDALSDAVATALAADGHDVVRLAGATRVETAVAVADAVRPGQGGTALLARADASPGNPTSAWADSVTGGALAAAAAVPILVTPTDTLHPAVAAWLDQHAPEQVVLLGGEAALAPTVADAVPGARRVAGPERTATAAAIAEDLWGAAGTGDRRFTILDGGREDGWAYGLAAAGLAADAAAPPLLVVGGTVSAATRRLVSTCGDPQVDLLLAGPTEALDDALAARLDTFDGTACAGEFAALSTFASCDELRDHLVAEALERVGPHGLDGHWWGAPVAEPAPAPSPAAPGAPPPSGAEGGEADGGDLGGRDDVSGTNVQEVGVDEPDVVKTDGDTAFVAAGAGVQVVDLTGPGPRHLTTVPTEVAGAQLLLHDGVLLVITPVNRVVAPPPGPVVEDVAFAPPERYPQPHTLLERYDVSDPAAPVLLDRAEVDGDYRAARLIEGTVRLVTTANPDLRFVVPADASDAAHQRALEANRDVITSAPVADWLPTIAVDGGEEEALVDCTALHVPPGFSGITTVTVVGIDLASSVRPTSAAGLLAQGETVYASADRLVVSSSRWGRWDGDAPPTDTVTTELHSFAIDDPTATTYVASGQVPGHALNQWALSERDGWLRVATTTEPPWTDTGPGQTESRLTVLTEGGGELFEVGSVGGLGLGERIFAVRYLGDLAAVVTFRQVDPLYLVDLANPAAPRVVGELKIPGVSEYLHPVGEDLLLGVGRDGLPDGTLTGLQLSLFDLADRSRPTRVDVVDLGPGSSQVEHDHRAFLYWAPTGRIVLPAQLHDEGFAGAKVVDVDHAARALEPVGGVTPPTGADRTAPIERSFVAGDALYTVSAVGLSAHDLVTLADRGHAAFPDAPCCGDGGGSVPGTPAPPPPMDGPAADGPGG